MMFETSDREDGSSRIAGRYGYATALFLVALVGLAFAMPLRGSGSNTGLR